VTAVQTAAAGTGGHQALKWSVCSLSCLPQLSCPDSSCVCLPDTVSNGHSVVMSLGGSLMLSPVLVVHMPNAVPGC
jgi:hypothetical protein